VTFPFSEHVDSLGNVCVLRRIVERGISLSDISRRIIFPVALRVVHSWRLIIGCLIVLIGGRRSSPDKFRPSGFQKDADRQQAGKKERVRGGEGRGIGIARLRRGGGGGGRGDEGEGRGGDRRVQLRAYPNCRQ
jgi:hypothetical protein